MTKHSKPIGRKCVVSDLTPFFCFGKLKLEKGLVDEKNRRFAES